jgi:catechol 2,3-dioxygenase-like lactoylglutathione lyase family enzyme
MLTKSTVTTVLPVQDAERAGRFYTDILGLRSIKTGPDGARFVETGCGDVIALRPLPNVRPTENTAFTFDVPDISKEIAELVSRGVRFFDYDTPDLQTENYIATMPNGKMAWFADSEGHLLGLFQGNG